MKLYLKGGSVSLLYILRSNASSKVNIWRLYIKKQREKSFNFTNNSWFVKAKKKNHKKENKKSSKAWFF